VVFLPRERRECNEVVIASAQTRESKQIMRFSFDKHLHFVHDAENVSITVIQASMRLLKLVAK